MSFEIAGHRVGSDERLFVVAELGLNHGGSVECALELVDAAAEAGASAVKLQTFVADELVASGAMAPVHVRETSLRAFFGRFQLDEQHITLWPSARANGGSRFSPRPSRWARWRCSSGLGWTPTRLRAETSRGTP